MKHFLVLFLATFVSFVFSCDGLNDEIRRLPGLTFDINFKHFSGFLQVSKTHFLHYWFVESQNDPANDPLIFWYNGGPGCSSLLGLLGENGPYEVKPNGKTLHSNPNAWSKFASVVYIEAPAGVGYSYSTDGNITTNDDLTAHENYEGVKQFFKRHPSFRNHSTFIMGESYGGTYLPMLTSQILDGQKDFFINLGGLAIGNGCVNAALNEETILPLLYYHGFIDENRYSIVEQRCCNGCMDTCNITALEGECAFMYGVLENSDIGSINAYNIYDSCNANPAVNSPRFTAYKEKIMPKKFVQNFYKDETEPKEAPCMHDEEIGKYMNLPYVRKALHIPENISEWEECNENFVYISQYDDMTPFVQKIVDAKVPVLLYYGDTDIVCNFMMGQKFVAQLGLPVEEYKKPWKVGGSSETGGFKTTYKGLTFLTIRGAGHMAPDWRAPETAYAIKQFVSNQPI